MRRLPAFLIALSLVCAPAFAQAPAQAPVQAPSGQGDIGDTGDFERAGFAFPARILDFERLSVRDYEAQAPGLGFSVGYRSPALVATVYIYNRLLGTIPAGIAAPEVRREFDAAFGEIDAAAREGYYRGFNRAELQENGRLPAEEGGVEFLQASIDLVGDGSGRRRTYLFATGLRGVFLKVRMTASAKPADQEARAFLRALSRQLGGAATGPGDRSEPATK